MFPTSPRSISLTSLFRGDSLDEISIWTLLHCAFGNGGIKVDIGIQCREATSACGRMNRVREVPGDGILSLRVVDPLEVISVIFGGTL
jgi:hypothetical protein